MTILKKPTKVPSHPYFGSGPCNKTPNWNANKIENSFISRSHRSNEGLKKIGDVVSLMKNVLGIPKNYILGITPGSATGAIETAIWNLLGERPLSVLTHDAFSLRWEKDIVDQLKIEKTSIVKVDHGKIPNVENIQKNSDILLNWNGSTSGAHFPFSAFKNQEGLIVADITSAAFCMSIPWFNIDAAAFSWQKGLGGEAGIGVLVLSPKAVRRIETYRPSWPIPYLFQLYNGAAFKKEIFEEKTINTPSMLSIEDFLHALLWAKSIGGLDKLIELSQENLQIVEEWVAQQKWVEFLTIEKNIRSSSTIIIKIIDQLVLNLSELEQRIFIKTITDRLESNEVAYDILNHPAAPPSIRIWGGPTIKQEDISILLDWIEWSFNTSISELSNA